jgi:aspartate kinase
MEQLTLSLQLPLLQGWKSGAVTTLGRGGTDLTATTIGKALGLKEIQVYF